MIPIILICKNEQHRETLSRHLRETLLAALQSEADTRYYTTDTELGLSRPTDDGLNPEEKAKHDAEENAKKKKEAKAKKAAKAQEEEATAALSDVVMGSASSNSSSADDSDGDNPN